MDSSKMKIICSVCKYYRTIVYADGGCAMGCLKASDNDYPVDIRHLDCCPRDQKKRRQLELDHSQLLKVLGKIYAKCVTSPAQFSLYEFLKEGEKTVRRYKASIGHAIIKMEVLKVVSRGTPGQRGNVYTYSWNNDVYGPPSLELVAQIAKTMSVAIEDQKIKRKAESIGKDSPKSRVLNVDEGVTSCELCWLRDCPDCHDKLVAMGLDCKKMNINTIRYGGSPVGQ